MSVELEKIVINMGLGEAIQNAKIIDSAVNDLMTISGQRPIVTKAKKSIAAFSSARNESAPRMTLRRQDVRILDRFVNIAPRVRSFAGFAESLRRARELHGRFARPADLP